MWIDGPVPFAFTAGWLFPKTFVSVATGSSLSEAGLKVVLDHEQEHRRRRDPLQRSLVWAITVLLPRGIRETLIGDWRLAAEQACDRTAAEKCGDRFLVANTIIAVERALATSVTPGVAFGGSTIEERIRHMLDENPPPYVVGRMRVIGMAAVTALLVASPVIHHGLETMLEALLG